MPCDSSHMQPSEGEIKSRNLARMVMYCHEHNVCDPNNSDWGRSKEVVEAANDMYGSLGLDDAMARWLCAALTVADEAWIYDGRTRERRDLADWWDEHQAADRARDEKKRRDHERFEARTKLANTKRTRAVVQRNFQRAMPPPVKAPGLR